MNEPEIGISYHGIAFTYSPITRNECGWYCTLLWWCTLYNILCWHGFVFSSILFATFFFFISMHTEKKSSEISKRELRTNYFFCSIHYILSSLSVLKHLCSILQYLCHFLFALFDRERKKIECNNNGYNKAVGYFLLLCECVCNLTQIDTEVLHVNKWEKFKV